MIAVNVCDCVIQAAVIEQVRIGTIEVGKEASFGLWTGDPIDPRQHCAITVIDGKVVYESEVDRVF